MEDLGELHLRHREVARGVVIRVTAAAEAAAAAVYTLEDAKRTGACSRRLYSGSWFRV